MSNLWELEEAQKALHNGQYGLCGRYLEKALERVRCMYCHGSLNSEKPYGPYFKGFVHDDCAVRYNGRLDYESQHPEEANEQ